MSEEGVHMSNLNPNAPPFGAAVNYCDNGYGGDMMPPLGSYGMQGGGAGNGAGDYDGPGSYGNMPPNQNPVYMNANMHFNNAYAGGGGGGNRSMAPSTSAGAGSLGMYYGPQQGGGNMGGSNMMGNNNNNNNSRGGRQSTGSNSNNSYNNHNTNSGMNSMGGSGYGVGGYGGSSGPHASMGGGGANKNTNAGMMMDRRRPVMMGGGANNNNNSLGNVGGYGMRGGGSHMQQHLMSPQQPPHQQQQQSSMYAAGLPPSHHQQQQPSTHPGQTPPLSSPQPIMHRTINYNAGIHSTPPLMHNMNKMMSNNGGNPMSNINHHHHLQMPHGSVNDGGMSASQGGGSMLPSSAMASRMNMSANTALNSATSDVNTPNRNPKSSHNTHHNNNNGAHAGMNRPGNRVTPSPPLDLAKTAPYMNYANNNPRCSANNNNNNNSNNTNSNDSKYVNDSADAAVAAKQQQPQQQQQQQSSNIIAMVLPEPPKVILVTGYKGTGKTMVAKALAKTRQYEYISLKPGAKDNDAANNSDSDESAAAVDGDDSEPSAVSLTQRLAPLTRLLQRHRQQPIAGLVIDDALLRNRYEAHYVHHLLRDVGLRLNVLVMVTMDLSDLEKRGVDLSDKADMHAHPESFEFGQEVEEASGSAAEAIVVVDGNAPAEQVVAEAEQQVSEAEQRELPGLDLPHVEFMPGCPLVTDPARVEEVLSAETRALSLGEDGYDFPYVEPNFMLDYVQFVRHALLFKNYLVKPWIWGDKVSVIGYGNSVYVHLPAYRILFEMTHPPEPLRALLRIEERAAGKTEKGGKAGMSETTDNINSTNHTLDGKGRSGSRSNSCRRASDSAAEECHKSEMRNKKSSSSPSMASQGSANDEEGSDTEAQQKAGERRMHFSLEGVMLDETLYIIDMMQLGNEMGAQLVLHARMNRLSELLSGLNSHDDGTGCETEAESGGGGSDGSGKAKEDDSNGSTNEEDNAGAASTTPTNQGKSNTQSDVAAEKDTSCRVRLLRHYSVQDVMKCITAYKKVARGLLFINPDGLQAGNYDSRNFIYPDEDRKTVQIRIWHGCCNDKGMWTFEGVARENDEEVQITHTDGSVIPVHISDKQVNEFSINDGNIVECVLESAAPPAPQCGQQQTHKGKKGGGAAGRGGATPRFVFQRRCFWQATPTTLYYQSAFSSPPTWPTRLFTEACAAIKHEPVHALE